MNAENHHFSSEPVIIIKKAQKQNENQGKNLYRDMRVPIVLHGNVCTLILI